MLRILTKHIGFTEPAFIKQFAVNDLLNFRQLSIQPSKKCVLFVLEKIFLLSEFPLLKKNI